MQPAAVVAAGVTVSPMLAVCLALLLVLAILSAGFVFLRLGTAHRRIDLLEERADRRDEQLLREFEILRQRDLRQEEMLRDLGTNVKHVTDLQHTIIKGYMRDA
ncbi:hypothetical protein [Brytella acorum]|uniref:Uncharacterized protein n=1 Tax=Brytella acorum TaxID=2959299 RepID=A0AA35VBP5_9PROT|nr:hypothetical protein [Brytella acorum]CAI9120462.1 hypothetical protein LMG32879_001295 [Brytella acorum]